MTDNEIIKALEHCRDNGCAGCPLEFLEDDKGCMTEWLDLINRQKAEIERLRENQDTLTTVLARSFAVKLCGGNPVAEIKAEAIKGFAERLKDYRVYVDDFDGEMVEWVDIDSVAEEMVGADNG